MYGLSVVVIKSICIIPIPSYTKNTMKDQFTFISFLSYAKILFIRIYVSNLC